MIDGGNYFPVSVKVKSELIEIIIIIAQIVALSSVAFGTYLSSVSFAA